VVSGQELVEEDAERIHVARSRDRVSPDLLGARVLRRHHRSERLRRRLLAVLSGREELRDPEVEELRRPVRIHQDVSRLQVAVDDEILVRVVDRFADGAEHLEPLSRRDLQSIAVLRDGPAVDELHDEIGLSFFRRSAIEDRGDVRMLETAENLPLLEEAAQEGLRADTAQELESDGLLEEVVVPDRPVDHGHAAAADLVQDAVGSDTPAFGGGEARSDGRKRKELPGLVVGREKGLDLLSQGLVPRAGPIQERRPRSGGLFEGRLEDGLEMRPGSGVIFIRLGVPALESPDVPSIPRRGGRARPWPSPTRASPPSAPGRDRRGSAS
jgi:hypothetical protein